VEQGGRPLVDFVGSSRILCIYKSLKILLPEQALADHWLSTPNDNQLFNGCAPVDRLLAGQVIDLAVVRDFLDSERDIPQWPRFAG
jgi:hypothetical protein